MDRTAGPCALVTGGAGFMGSHVAAELVGMGYRVVVLDDLSGGRRDNVPAGAELVRGSIVDHETVNRLFDRWRFDYVFHLAAYAAEGLSHFIKRYNYTNNVIGSVNLINAAVNTETVRCFVFTSSIAVYGPGQVPLVESLVP
jgi:UDP-glucose 4-epimerase